MNQAAVLGAASENLQFAEVTAVVRRKNGTIEHHVLTQYEKDEHRAKREAAGISLPAPTFNMPPSKLASFFRRAARFIGLGVLLLAATHLPHGECLGAATVITNAGQAIVTNRIIGSGTEPKFVAWGTGAGTAAASDTTLFTESTDEARATGTSSRVTTTVTNDTYQVVGTITVATTNKTITNVGLFDVITTSSGNLYFKSDFTGLALLIGDSITFTLKVKYS